MWKTRRFIKPQDLTINSPVIQATENTIKYPYSVCICGVIRDGEKYFKSTISNLHKISSCFKESKIIIVESDSTDNTVSLFSQESGIIFHSMGKLEDTMSSREDRISTCRNFYLQKVLSEYSEYDLMLIIDLDDVLEEPFDIKSLERCMDSEVYPTWDAVFANQSYRYYDIWALRNEEVDYDCWQKVHSGEMTRTDAILKHQYHIPKDTPFIPVRSAFGGLGIYKIKNLDSNCKYQSLQSDGSHRCEHLELNLYLIEKGCRLFIDPALVLETPVSFAKYYVAS